MPKQFFFALIFFLIHLFDLQAFAQNQCSDLFNINQNQRPSLHTAREFIDPLGSSRAGLSEINLTGLKVSEKSSLLKVRNNLNDNSTTFQSENSTFTARYKINSGLLYLVPFRENTNEFDPVLVPSTGTHLNFKVINNSDNPVELTISLQAAGFETFTFTKLIESSQSEQDIILSFEEMKVIRKNLNVSQKPEIIIQARSRKNSKIDLTLIDSIVVQRDPRAPDLNRILKSAFYRVASEATPRLTKRQSDALFNRILKQLFDIEIQKKAIALINDPNSLQIFLKSYELYLTPLSEKVSPTGGSVNGYKVESFFGGLNQMSNRHVPTESGAFALEHGQLSHAYQLACLLYGANKNEAEIIISFFSRLITEGGARGSWALWDTFFDGSGNTLPTEPRYWRDLEKK